MFTRTLKTEMFHLLSVVPLLFTQLIIHCNAATVSSLPTVQFGNSCDLSQPCDTTQGLACISNICQCVSPSNQRYDNSTQKCVSVVGGPCTTAAAANDLTQDCIRNAFCSEKRDESGELYTECQCDMGYIENSSGDCVPGIGQPCSYLPDECNPLGMVVCKNGRCECLDNLQVYDVDMQRCVSPAGTHCKYERASSSLQLGCVKNAICYPFFYWVPPKCLCKPGYVQTKSRQCVPESDYNNRNQMNSLLGGNNGDNQDVSGVNARAIQTSWDRTSTINTN